MHTLARLLAPRSVALVGATDRAGSPGAVVLSNLRAGPFRGEIFTVGPGHASIASEPSFESLADLPATPDLAIVVAPARVVPEVIAQAGARDIRGVLVLSPDFDASTEAARRRALSSARKQGVRLLGPDCLGIVRPDIGFNATLATTQVRAGSLALVSQSAALMAALLDYAWAAGFGFSSAVSTGDCADVEFSEILDFLALDETTRSIVLYVERVNDARAFVSSVRAAASAKPVVVLKAGKHLDHDPVFDAALTRAGAIRVRAYNQMFSAAEALAAGRLPPASSGNRLAILSNGAGPGNLAADAALEAGVTVAKLSPAAAKELSPKELSPAGSASTLDLPRDSDPTQLAQSLRVALEDSGNDAVLLLLSPAVALGVPEDAARELLEVARSSMKPLIAVWLGEADAGRGRAAFKAAGLPSPTSPERGVESFGYLAHSVRNRQLRLQVPPPHVAGFEHDLRAARALVDTVRAGGRLELDPVESQQLLACFGIESAPMRRALSPEEATACARAIGYPVAMKVLAEGIASKSEVDGVLLGLRNARAVAAGFETLRARLTKRAPKARFAGALVQRMVKGEHGRELVVALQRAPGFGPVIVFGNGGVAADVLRDIALALPPLNGFLAHDLIARTRVARLLGQFQHLEPVDMDALLNVLLRLSDLACEMPCIESLAVNPLVASPRGATALDVRVRLNDASLVPDAVYSHLAIHPYPRRLERPLQLQSGEQLLLRPIRPEDATAEQRYVARLSPRSLTMRFHAPIKELTLERLVRFTQIDYDREMALVAVDAGGEQEEIRGVARYTRDPDGAGCEFGLAVEDAWQRRGIGAALMNALEACAAERGLDMMVGFVLPDNDEMARLLAARGYRARRDEHDPGVMRFEKKLSVIADR